MTAVSVVIPTYGHRDFVGAALDSVFAQTFTDYEVIVVNDGSPDDTAAVLRPYADAGRIRYVEQPNAGQAAARNRGISLARGEFIALLDDDDLWPADKLAWQVAALRRVPGASLVGGATSAIDCDGRVLWRHGWAAGAFGKPALADGCPFQSPGQVLIRREAIRAAGGLDATVWGADDYDLYLRLADRAPWLNEDRVALLYRVHAANASRDRRRMLRNCTVVVRRHFPGFTAGSLKAYRWLYVYAGREQVRRVRRSAGDRRLLATASELRLVWPFALHACVDPRLAKALVKDCMCGREGKA